MDAANGQAQTIDADAKPDLFRAITDLIGASQHFHQDPASVESIGILIDRLRHVLLTEKHEYTHALQNSERRKRIESLHNLIKYLELQADTARKAVQRRGIRHYLASIVLGDEVSRIGRSMGTKLQSWLDQQGVRDLSVAISSGSEDARMKDISSFKDMVERGYDGVLQETILSCGMVEKLAALLRPSTNASWPLRKEAALALCALLDFNKDIFLSLILMMKVVESLVQLIDKQPDEHVVFVVFVLNGLLSAGQTIIADEIHAQNGVAKIVRLLDHKSQQLQLAAMCCVFELAYCGRIEVVQEMFELGVVEKLAALHQSSMIAAKIDHADINLLLVPGRELDLGLVPGDTNAAEWANTSCERTALHPFSNAVTRFALHCAVGTGLRKRERRALKRQLLKQIQEIMEDDAEAANIAAEVLWAP